MLNCDLSLITIHRPISDCCQFSDIHISQGSVETCFGCSGIVKLDFVANLPVSLSVKEFWKPVNIWVGNGQEFGVLFFETQCIWVCRSSRSFQNRLECSGTFESFLGLPCAASCLGSRLTLPRSRQPVWLIGLSSETDSPAVQMWNDYQLCFRRAPHLDCWFRPIIHSTNDCTETWITRSSAVAEWPRDASCQ